MKITSVAGLKKVKVNKVKVDYQMIHTCNISNSQCATDTVTYLLTNFQTRRAEFPSQF